MAVKKINLSDAEWEQNQPGLRFKAVEQDAKRVRIIEISENFADQEWCLTGHTGLVLSGELDIEFDEEVHRFRPGDIIFISAGEQQKHRPLPPDDMVRLFLVEDV